MIKYPDSYAVYDTETTGIDIKTAEIVELAAIVVSKGVVVNRKSWLIKPSTPMTEENMQIHGIRNEDVEGKPSISEVLPEFCALVKGLPLVGHNISRYDNPLISRFLGSSPPDWIDTAALYKARIHGFVQRWHENHMLFAERVLSMRLTGKYNLLLAYQTLGGKAGEFTAHRALGDCDMTLFVYNALTQEKLSTNPTTYSHMGTKEEPKKETPEAVPFLQEMLSNSQEPEVISPHNATSFRFNSLF